MSHSIGRNDYWSNLKLFETIESNSNINNESISSHKKKISCKKIQVLNIDLQHYILLLKKFIVRKKIVKVISELNVILNRSLKFFKNSVT